MRMVSVLALVSLTVALPLAAQQAGTAPPAGYRQTQFADLERERGMTLAMVDSMPERLLHYKPVPEVRDFAQQIAHAATSIAVFAARAKGESPPDLGDSTVYLASKAALRAAVNRSYDYSVSALRAISDADYTGETMFFGRRVPRWRIFDSAREHSVWTRGEIVVYFRLNGMAPPSFELFPRP